ncbi:hypothetical protein [Clostridium transplantifaecale]|uniref:hypothetical protein n=1 Tax=Clostridium transplantifaecale TaxID=2479838 RepID=UPI000F64426A|nr:hypothetical protein [Clostridium transplantifaecale]
MNQFESWEVFLDYVKLRILNGEFKDFFQLLHIDINQLTNIWTEPDLYDMDYIEPDEWEGFKEMFPSPDLYQKFISIAPVMEVRSCRARITPLEAVFYVVGGLHGQHCYRCFAYGFEVLTGYAKSDSSYVCLLDKSEE